MPRYDYRCSNCGREVEVMHGIHESGPQACDDCGGAMRKALSSPAIHFKGSGWAKKDAAATAAKPSSKTGSTAAGETAAKSAAKSTSTGDGDTGSSGGKAATASDGPRSGGGSGPGTKAD